MFIDNPDNPESKWFRKNFPPNIPDPIRGRSITCPNGHDSGWYDKELMHYAIPPEGIQCKKYGERFLQPPLYTL